MIDYYEYDTSPKKEETRHGGTAIKERRRNDIFETPEFNIYTRKSSYYENDRRNREEENIDLKKKVRQAKIAESRKNARHIIEIGGAFIILFVISYRYALINSKFNEKENLKDELSQIQKENAQLQVSIEQGMNVKNIEKEARWKIRNAKIRCK